MVQILLEELCALSKTALDDRVLVEVASGIKTL
jgi:hypothetical protein